MDRLQAWCGLSVLALCALPAGAAEVDPYVPADATAVASVNVRQLLDSSLAQKYAPELLRFALKQNATWQRMLSVTGIDPLKDVNGVVLAANGTKPEQGLLIVHGKFDVDNARKSAEDFARQHPGQLVISREGNAVIYEARAAKQRSFVALVGSETVLAALSRDALVKALRSGGKGPPQLVRTEVKERVSQAEDTHTAWLVALPPPDLKKQLTQGGGNAQLGDKIKVFTATLDVDRDVQATVTVHTTDAKAADSVAEMVDSARGLVRLVAGNQPGVGDLLGAVVENLKVTTRKNAAEITVRVEGEVIAKAVDALPKVTPKKP